MKLTSIIFCFFLVTLSSLSSCKKKTIEKTEPTTPTEIPCDTTFIDNYINDTIYPSPYLMAYPGSQWNYDDGSTETYVSWAQVGFAVPTSTSDGCVTVTKTYHIMPVRQTIYSYICGSKSANISNPNKTKFVPLLDTVAGQFYFNHEDFGDTYQTAGYYEDTRTVEELLDSMTVLGTTYYDVIHVHTYSLQYFTHISSGDYGTTECYYAKNIGLIRKEQSYMNGTPSIKNLVSYSIGPH